MAYIDRDPLVAFLAEKIRETGSGTHFESGYRMGLQFAKSAVELTDGMPDEEPYLEQMMAEVERSHSSEEIAHSMADGILCDLLTELGYERLVKAFGDVWKWYA